MTGFAIAFSTSSPLTSVAFIDSQWKTLWAKSEMAPRAATSACARLLEEGLASLDLKLADATSFGADLGPGSFTGVRVGVMMAKTLAFASNCATFGSVAFDLVSETETVSIPSRKNEWWVRVPGQEPFRSETPVGLSYPGDDPAYPLAERFASLVAKPSPVAPELLVPAYFAEPSISTPKRRFGPSEALI